MLCYEQPLPLLQGSSNQATNVVTSEDSDSEDDRNELELSWDRKEPVMLDMEERMMKEEDIYDILTELSLPVGELSVVWHDVIM